MNVVVTAAAGSGPLWLQGRHFPWRSVPAQLDHAVEWERVARQLRAQHLRTHGKSVPPPSSSSEHTWHRVTLWQMDGASGRPRVRARPWRCAPLRPARASRRWPLSARTPAGLMYVGSAFLTADGLVFACVLGDPDAEYSICTLPLHALEDASQQMLSFSIECAVRARVGCAAGA